MYDKKIEAYLKTQVINLTLDWEQHMAPMMFAYNTSDHGSIKTSPFDVTFRIAPRTGQNPNPDLRIQYGEYLSTEMFKD